MREVHVFNILTDYLSDKNNKTTAETGAFYFCSYFLVEKRRTSELLQYYYCHPTFELSGCQLTPKYQQIVTFFFFYQIKTSSVKQKIILYPVLNET